MSELELGQRVEVHRGGDPAIPTALDGRRGVVIGHSTAYHQDSMGVVPTVGVRFRDGKHEVAWIVRWHVRPLPETLGEKVARRLRVRLKEMLG